MCTHAHIQGQNNWMLSYANVYQGYSLEKNVDCLQAKVHSIDACSGCFSPLLFVSVSPGWFYAWHKPGRISTSSSSSLKVNQLKERLTLVEFLLDFCGKLAILCFLFFLQRSGTIPGKHTFHSVQQIKKKQLFVHSQNTVFDFTIWIIFL